MTRKGGESQDGRLDIKQALHHFVHGVQYISHIMLRKRKPIYGKEWQPPYGAPLPYDDGTPKILRAQSEPSVHVHASAAEQLTFERAVFHAFEETIDRKAGEITSSQRKLRKIQRKTSDQRYESLRYRENFRSTLAFLDRDLEAILNAVKHHDLRTLQAKLESALFAHDQIRLDMDRMRDSDIALMQMDNAMSDDHQRLTESITALVTSLGLTGTPGNAASSISGDSNTGKPPSQTPTLLTQYLDRRGDVQILRERVADLEANYLDLAQQREFRRDRHEELSTTDEEFEQQYYALRTEQIEQLRQAEDDTAALESACRAHGSNISVVHQSEPLDSDDERPSVIGGPYVIVPQWMDQIA